MCRGNFEGEKFVMFSAFNRIRKNILFCFTNFNIDWQGTDVTPLITLIDDQIANLPRMNFTCIKITPVSEMSSYTNETIVCNGCDFQRCNCKVCESCSYCSSKCLCSSKCPFNPPFNSSSRTNTIDFFRFVT